MGTFRVTLFDDDTCQKEYLILMTAKLTQFDAITDITAQALMFCYNHDHFNFKIDKIERLAEGEI